LQLLALLGVLALPLLPAPAAAPSPGTSGGADMATTRLMSTWLDAGYKIRYCRSVKQLMIPTLRQDWELGAFDLEAHPIWLCVHGSDEGEEWYQKCDEATFRPWEGTNSELSDRLLIVSAVMTLPNGRTYPGACYAGGIGVSEPSDRDEVIDVQEAQPRLFVSDNTIRFWGGMDGIPSVERRRLFASIGTVNSIFPILFEVRPELARLCKVRGGTIRGFYRVASALGDDVTVETDTEPTLCSGALESSADPKREVLALVRKGAFADAFQRCQELIAWAPNDVGWRRLLVTVCELTGDFAGALRAIEEVLVLSPNDDSLHAWACRLCLGLGDFEECLRQSDRGLAIVSPDAIYEEILALYGARALYQLGRPAEAVDRLRKVFPGTFLGYGSDPLLTRRGLLAACRGALRRDREVKGRSPARRSGRKSE
jgi:hypothetical protein